MPTERRPLLPPHVIALEMELLTSAEGPSSFVTRYDIGTDSLMSSWICNGVEVKFDPQPTLINDMRLSLDEFSKRFCKPAAAAWMTKKAEAHG
jgi:hypothetical protein